MFELANKALLGLITALEQGYNPLTMKEKVAHRQKGHYVYIALSPLGFIESLLVVDRLLGRKSAALPKFLDVGCGIGSKVILAGQLGLDAYGLEVNAKYAKIAEALVYRTNTFYDYESPQPLKRTFKKIFRADGRKFDYSPYDIIYFYVPNCNAAAQEQMTDQIITTAKKGTFILAFGGAWKFDKHPKFKLHPSTNTGHIYEKIEA